MTVVDARFRVHHPCPYCDVSEKFPRSLLLLWCDNRRDIFLVSSPDRAELRRVVGVLRASFRARPLLEDGTDALVTVPDFEWPDPPSVTGLARRTGVWVLHPVVYFDGTETYRIVAATKRELNRFVGRVRRLGDVEILSVSGRAELRTIRDLPTASVHFFEGLTDRQARCLVAAFEGGLFDVPTRTGWGEVADRERLSRSTFGEHLRKGQYRIMANSFASLKARTLASERTVLLPGLPPSPRRSRDLGYR
ncbi:MAG TPA: helix-turn-helix domain-containing protein [Thermoplasmata archaeon]|nr:helix-turn-helix domain-containing protein [Thermoplasmata archaeon]